MHKKEILIENILNDIKYQKTTQNKKIVEHILDNSENNIEYVWKHIPSLIKKLEHLKGYVALSSSKDRIKITYDTETIKPYKEIAREFYEICNKWATKYKIKLNYDYEKEVFYII